MELKSYQHNSFCAEDISIDMSQNNSDKNKNFIVSDAAIKLTDVSISFGKNKVLQGLDITVPYGKIYSIVGPKKCGKTLILQSIIGLIKPSKGEIKVLNRRPGYFSDIGYMPQDMSLFDDLTISETIKYFGQLYDLPVDLINNKIDFLIESLSVKNKNILIRCLNNNDKVIVSLAVTVLHSPELLILDEPTIYGDPLLKKLIWKQFRNLCDIENVTIIISTSHIEEVQHSDIVALVSDGCLVEEEVQKHLMKGLDFNSVGDIFLNLFEKKKFNTYDQKRNLEMSCNCNNNNSSDNKIAINGNSFTDIDLSPNVSKVTKIKTSSIDRISALYYRNLKSKLRNIHLLIFQLLFPAIAVSLFCACIGHNPYDIPVGVYNPDRPSFASDIILKSINTKVISLRYYDSFESVINGIRQHEVWAALTFPRNYTRSMLERASQGCEPAEELLEYDIEDEISEEPMIHSQNYTMKSNNQTNAYIEEDPSEREVEDDNEEHEHKEKNSLKDEPFDNEDDQEVNDYEAEHVASKPKLMTTMELYIDNTNLLISGAIKGHVLMALKNARNRSIELSIGSSHAPPIQIMDPTIYGFSEVEMSEYITPGVVIAVIFLSSVLFPGLAIIKERKERHLERSTIAGVKALELIISHLMIHIVILIIQITFILTCIFMIFEFPSIGSIYLSFLLIFIQGLCGLIYSITISSFCCDESQAITVWLTTFSVIIILGGTFWPIECMPKFAGFVSNILPQAIAGNGLRSILSRGWDLTYTSIQLSLIVPIIWIVILFTISVLLFRIRK